MRDDTKPSNTAGRSTDQVSRSNDVRHEASTDRRRKRPKPTIATPTPDRLVSVHYDRTLIHAPDAGAHKATAELVFTTSRGLRLRVPVDPSDMCKPAMVIAKAINQTALYPADEKALTAQVHTCIDADPRRVIVTTISGWKGSASTRAFVTPGRSFGPGKRGFQYHFPPDHDSNGGLLGAVRGDLTAWRRNVGDYLEMSTAGCVILGSAMAAPLLRLAKVTESWIMLLCGGSTTGKSTLLAAVASFQGAETVINPRTSDRGFTEQAAMHNDLLMPVGDLSQLTKPDRRRVLHFLTMDSTSGAGRSVSRAVRGTLPDLTFTTIAAASAEHSSVEIAREAGVPRLPGEQVGRSGVSQVRAHHARMSLLHWCVQVQRVG